MNSARLGRPFRLMRYFSLASLVGIVIVTAALIWTWRTLTVQHLVEHETRDNTSLTRAFAQAVWPQFRDFIQGSTGRSAQQLQADPAVAALDAAVRSRLGGIKVVKVKIYNLGGLTVYSSDARQIGEDKSANEGFLDARAGRASSLVTHRDTFDAFEGEIANRNLISSYIPFASARAGAPEAVFEIYSDVTELLDTQREAQWQVAATVFSALTLLYLFLCIVVRRADRVIAEQEGARAQQETRIRHQAYHDALTGLPNRAYFAERLAEALSQAQRHQRTLGVMFIDLDRFKIVNDSLGHHAGDELLKRVSDRIRACLRDGDLLFRMGGDEFTVILPEVAVAEDAGSVARRIIASVSSPLAVAGHDLNVGATIGISVYPGDGDDAELLVKNADAAMYSAKAAGRGRHAFYRAEMNQRAIERLDLEAALQRGFREGEFELYYQPRVDAATRRIVAVEALLRWNSPSGGLVGAESFIDVLEDCGMMPMVAQWTIRGACAQMRRWQQEGTAPQRVSINVSARQFQAPGFDAMVARVLSDTGLPPSAVELELTESLLVSSPKHTGAIIAALKALGVRISIDDFGTASSSLGYLHRFAVDTLKIDRSFIAGIDADASTGDRDRALVVAIAELARAMGIGVVAEGVESERHARFFDGIGCDEMQGFLFSRPVTAQQMHARLASERSKAVATEPVRQEPARA